MRYHSQSAKKKWKKRIQAQMFDIVTVVNDDDDARRAPQGVILAVKGSSAHANPDHMYTQSPFEALKITCARSWRSHVHTSEPTITCTHKYFATAITCTHHYSYILIKKHYSYTLIKSHETFRVYWLLHLM